MIHFLENFRWVKFIELGTDKVILKSISEFLTAREAALDAAGDPQTFNWPAFEERIDELNHMSATGSRTGDVLMIMDGPRGYLALLEGDTFPGWHGGPTFSESHIPLMYDMPDLDHDDNPWLEAALPPVGNIRNWQLSEILRIIAISTRGD